MKTEQSKEQALGMLFAVGAYILWGILPIYWKLLEQVPAEEVLAHRIIWSFLFLLIILLLIGKFNDFLIELKTVSTQPKKLIGVVFTTIFISLNWFVYIWAVNNEQIIQTSIGYYINPLVSVLLGILVLKEKLSFWQVVALVLAAAGVLNITFHFGSIPWVSLILALSFGFYGLLKKMANLGAITGLTIETLFITPIAMLYLLYIGVSIEHVHSFHLENIEIIVLLICSGIFTALPLLLFASGTRRISLTLIGFFQYIAPTMTLIIGVWLYNEPFTEVHLHSFMFIWTGLLIFSLAKTKLFIRLQPKLKAKNKSFQG